MTKDTFYITTPIYYVTDEPHIGHAYNAVAADFIARYHRLAGHKVFLLTGTDEHGQHVARAAERRGMQPQAWCDEIVPKWKQVWERLEISYDDFIRTTEERHINPVGKFWQKVFETGDVYLGKYEGPYCVSCETFYQPDEVPDGMCPIHERPVETVNEENYFFRLSSYQDRLLDLYDKNPDFVKPESRLNEAVSFVKSGLDDLSISRTSFTWGIPVPWDSKHILYVWIDALLNYVTAAGFEDDPLRFGRLWPADYHLIGKDILRLHAVIWPAMLMAVGIELPKTVFAHGWLTVGGKKMSKSNATGISPHELLDVVGVDGYRYHFLREGTFGQDGSYSWEAMIARYNADLANDLGNLVSRTLAMVDSYFGGLVPEPGEETQAETDLRLAATTAAAELESCVRRLDVSRALVGVFELVKAANHYIDAAAPWNLAKDPSTRERLATVLYSVCEAIRQISLLVSPAMPAASRRIRAQLGLSEVDDRPLDTSLVRGQVWTGVKVQRGDSIFPRIEPDS